MVAEQIVTVELSLVIEKIGRPKPEHGATPLFQIEGESRGVIRKYEKCCTIDNSAFDFICCFN